MGIHHTSRFRQHTPMCETELEHRIEFSIYIYVCQKRRPFITTYYDYQRGKSRKCRWKLETEQRLLGRQATRCVMYVRRTYCGTGHMSTSLKICSVCPSRATTNVPEFPPSNACSQKHTKRFMMRPTARPTTEEINRRPPKKITLYS